MGLKEEWKSLSGEKKMMIVGGGGLAVFFLITAIKNKMSGSTQVSQATQTTQTIDPSSSLDAMTSQMQDLQNQIQAMQDSQTNPTDTGTNQQDLLNQYKSYVTSMMNKNQTQTNAEIQSLINRMGNSFKPPDKIKPGTQPPAAYSHPIKGPTHPVTPSKPVVKANPIKGPTHPIIYEAYGKTSLNSSLWGLSKMYLMNHGGLKNPTNAQIQSEVNKVVNLNHVKNPNVIGKGQKFKMN